MSAEAWPTEEAATAAVDAAARKVYEIQRPSIPGVPVVEWEHLGPVAQLNVREAVLPVVWAALAALPDPRYAAWEEGLHARRDFRGEVLESNPYPSGV